MLCIYVCMYGCMYGCMYVLMYVCMFCDRKRIHLSSELIFKLTE